MRIIVPTDTQPSQESSVSYSQAFDQIRQKIEKRSYPREPLAKILRDYNQQMGADASVLGNIEKLARPNSACVVTGQQLGMMGGPIYTILKGITCLLVAKQTNAVPIFWLATEDHDISEIDHTYLLDLKGNLKRFHLSFPKIGLPVEYLLLTSQNIEEINSFWSFLGLKEMPLPSVGDLYCRSMVQLLMRLFEGTGLVFLEPKLLRPLAVPFFSRESQQCEAIHHTIKKTTEDLEKTGVQPAIHLNGPTNLFLKDKQQKRSKVRLEGKEFVVGHDRYSLDEILSKIAHEPELFSPNVAARPVLQNTLLPVLAYIAGPSEMAYHRQLVDYHQFHEAVMPCLIPRLSATFIPPYAASLLEASGMQPWDEMALSKTAVPSHSLHVLRNLIYPHQGPQERVFNWWGFQANTQENLVRECLDQLSWNSNTPYYLYL